MDPRAAELIRDLRLEAHPEGGFYREIFRSVLRVHPDDGRPVRSALTTIYFLLTKGSHSRWHRVASDEVWHLCEGGPLELYVASLDSTSIACAVLGPALASDGPVHIVPAGCWQAARHIGSYALVACTVGPGFDFADFELLRDDPRMHEHLARLGADGVALL